MEDSGSAGPSRSTETTGSTPPEMAGAIPADSSLHSSQRPPTPSELISNSHNQDSSSSQSIPEALGIDLPVQEMLWENGLLILHVFSFLTAQDLCRCCLVSRTFRAAAIDTGLWQRLLRRLEPHWYKDWLAVQRLEPAFTYFVKRTVFTRTWRLALLHEDEVKTDEVNTVTLGSTSTSATTGDVGSFSSSSSSASTSGSSNSITQSLSERLLSLASYLAPSSTALLTSSFSSTTASLPPSSSFTPSPSFTATTPTTQHVHQPQLQPQGPSLPTPLPTTLRFDNDDEDLRWPFEIRCTLLPGSNGDSVSCLKQIATFFTAGVANSSVIVKKIFEEIPEDEFQLLQQNQLQNQLQKQQTRVETLLPPAVPLSRIRLRCTPYALHDLESKQLYLSQAVLDLGSGLMAFSYATDLDHYLRTFSPMQRSSLTFDDRQSRTVTLASAALAEKNHPVMHLADFEEGLHTLDFRRAMIKQIDPAIFDRVRNVRALFLAENELAVFPPEICLLTQLTFLDVAENNLTSIPEEIGTLTNLKYLRLSRNPITPTIPDSIGNLTRLNMLRLFQTDITSVPETVTKLVNLVELDFGETKIQSLPEGIGRISTLRILRIEFTEVHHLPPSFVDLRLLEFQCDIQALDQASKPIANKLVLRVEKLVEQEPGIFSRRDGDTIIDVDNGDQVSSSTSSPSSSDASGGCVVTSSSSESSLFSSALLRGSLRSSRDNSNNADSDRLAVEGPAASREERDERNFREGVKVYDLATGDNIHFGGHLMIRSMDRFAPPSPFLATAGPMTTKLVALKIWNFRTGELVRSHRWPWRKFKICKLIGLTERLMAVVHTTSRISIYDVSKGIFVHENLKTPSAPAEDDEATQKQAEDEEEQDHLEDEMLMQFETLPELNMLLMYSGNNEFCLWDYENGRLAKHFKFPCNGFIRLRSHPEQVVIASWDMDIISIWEIDLEGDDGFKLISKFNNLESVLCLAQLDDLLFSGDREGLKLWDIETGRCKPILVEHLRRAGIPQLCSSLIVVNHNLIASFNHSVLAMFHAETRDTPSGYLVSEGKRIDPEFIKIQRIVHDTLQSRSQLIKLKRSGSTTSSSMATSSKGGEVGAGGEGGGDEAEKQEVVSWNACSHDVAGVKGTANDFSVYCFTCYPLSFHMLYDLPTLCLYCATHCHKDHMLLYSEYLSPLCSQPCPCGSRSHTLPHTVCDEPLGAVRSGTCTADESPASAIVQRFFACSTCLNLSASVVCEHCARTCHRGHDLVETGIRQMICGCGQGGHKCMNAVDMEAENEKIKIWEEELLTSISSSILEERLSPFGHPDPEVTRLFTRGLTVDMKEDIEFGNRPLVRRLAERLLHMSRGRVLLRFSAEVYTSHEATVFCLLEELVDVNPNPSSHRTRGASGSGASLTNNNNTNATNNSTSSASSSGSSSSSSSSSTPSANVEGEGETEGRGKERADDELVHEDIDATGNTSGSPSGSGSSDMSTSGNSAGDLTLDPIAAAANTNSGAGGGGGGTGVQTRWICEKGVLLSGTMPYVHLFLLSDYSLDAPEQT